MYADQFTAAPATPPTANSPERGSYAGRAYRIWCEPPASPGATGEIWHGVVAGGSRYQLWSCSRADLLASIRRVIDDGLV